MKQLPTGSYTRVRDLAVQFFNQARAVGDTREYDYFWGVAERQVAREVQANPAATLAASQKATDIANEAAQKKARGELISKRREQVQAWVADEMKFWKCNYDTAFAKVQRREVAFFNEPLPAIESITDRAAKQNAAVGNRHARLQELGLAVDSSDAELAAAEKHSGSADAVFHSLANFYKERDGLLDALAMGKVCARHPALWGKTSQALRNSVCK